MKPDHPSVPNLGGTQTAQACHTPSGAWMGEDGSRRNPVGSDIIRARRRVSEAACSPAGGGDNKHEHECSHRTCNTSGTSK